MLIPQTRTNIKDPAAATSLGSILALLSGLILYADKLIDYFNLQIEYEFQYYGSLEVFVWVVASSVGPLMMILAFLLRAAKWSFASPFAAYTIQMMYVFRDEKFVAREYFWHSTIAFVIFFLVLAYVLQNYTTTIRKLKGKIRFIMNLMVVKTIDKELVKNIEDYTVEIVNPAIDKLDE